MTSVKGYGEVIRQLRKEWGISQLDLGNRLGIDMSTISRIENETREPREQTLRILLEYLGDLGFFSAYFFDRDNLLFLEKSRKVLDCYEYNNMDEFLDELMDLRVLIDENNITGIQFYKLMNALNEKRILKETKVSIELLEDILKLSIDNYEIGREFPVIPVGQVEVFILNNIAGFHLEQKEYALAEKLLIKLITILHKGRYFFPLVIKCYAVLYNNLALCEAREGKYSIALDLIKKAIRYQEKSGGSFFGLKLIKTQIYIKSLCMKREEYFSDLIYISESYKRLSKKIKKYNQIEDFFAGDCFLEVF